MYPHPANLDLQFINILYVLYLIVKKKAKYHLGAHSTALQKHQIE